VSQPIWHTTYGHMSQFEPGFEQRLFEYPQQALEQAFRPPKALHVAVIGGGMAGLTAAYELAELGQSVTLFEASDRWGGRVRTAWRGQTYAELGAMRVPEAHGCTRHYIKEFDLPEVKFRMEDDNGLIMLRGKAGTRGRVTDLFPDLPVDSAGIINPFRIDDVLLEQITPEFGDDEWRIAYGVDDFRNDAASRFVRRCDQTPLWSYVVGDIDPRPSLPIAGGLPPPRLRLSADLWERIARLTGDIWFEPLSLLQWVLQEQSLRSAGKFRIDGGMSRLTDAFVSSVASKPEATIKLQAPVLRVDTRGDKVAVVWNEGRRELRAEFDYVICALPAPATSRIAFEPPLDHDVREALTNIHYLPLAKAAVFTRRRRWQHDNGIVGGASYTDLAIQQVWYGQDGIDGGPSDNQEDADPLVARVTGPSRIHEFEPQTPPNASISPETPGSLLAYMWGANARRFAAMAEGDRVQLVLSDLEQLHPGITNDVEGVVTAAWNGADCGGGAVAYFLPGEQQRYQGFLTQPHPGDHPRVFFAGEHLAIVHTWIQSAMQTALVAVLNVLEAARVASSP
jgi:monoamine oxidase